jgi:tRNA (guanine37-N1)-methyltransferase
MKSVKEILKKKLRAKELALVPSSFDLVGDILIFADFPDALKKQKLVAESFLDFYKNIKVICKKTKKYSGTFRTPRLKILAGEKRKETIHRENNCAFRLNVETCYFSPRLGHERKRIAQLVKSGEKILVMFSGVAPYPLTIARNSKAKLVCAIEKNPKAHKYAEDNIRLNKVSNVRLFRGDVKSVLPKMKLAFDRVIMPLPKGAETFLEIALPKVKRNGTLHFYDFQGEDDFSEAAQKIFAACKKAKKKCKILGIVKCGQYSPRVFRVCVDVKVF